MKIQERLTWISDNGNRVEMAPDLPFTIEEATGMDGLKSTVYTEKNANQDGVTQTGASLGARNITLSGTIQEREGNDRDILLTAFSTKHQGILIHEEPGRRLQIRATVEQAPTFSEDDTNQLFFVSLLAPDPFWKNVTETKVEIAEWIPSLAFDFEIDDENGLMFDVRAPSAIALIYNEGHVETGMRVVFKAAGTVEAPQLVHIGTRKMIKLNTTMRPGEQITVSTIPGERGVVRISDGVAARAIQLLDPKSEYFDLLPGLNKLCYGAESGRDALDITLHYAERFLGV